MVGSGAFLVRPAPAHLVDGRPRNPALRRLRRAGFSPAGFDRSLHDALRFEPKSPGPEGQRRQGLDRRQAAAIATATAIPTTSISARTSRKTARSPIRATAVRSGSDRDKDGIPDDADACPDVPEDKDGVADHDGCPEDDADKDKIPDAEDKCPTEPGPRSSDAEKNGCPLIKEDDGQVTLLEPIEFEFGKAAIKPVSFPILDEVVKLMQSRQKMRIGVYGHTDNVGSDANNLRLSKDRAASVMAYLAGKGINKGRLESEGFGETKPVDDATTPTSAAPRTAAWSSRFWAARRRLSPL